MDLHLHDKVELKKAHPCGIDPVGDPAGGHGHQAQMPGLRA